MGGKSEVVDNTWAQLVPNAVSTVAEAPACIIPGTPAGRKRLWICDIPGWLMSRSSPGRQKACTFGDWINNARGKIEFYFKDIMVDTVAVLLDCRSDPAKSILRDRGTSSRPAPLTPSGGWEDHLIEYSRQYHDYAASFVGMAKFPELEILLPGDDENASKFTFAEYMQNRDFKYGFFIPLVCKHLLTADYITLPNRTIIFRGKNTALGYCNGEIYDLPPELAIPYTEADCIIGKLAAIFKDHTVMVDAPDFDVLSNCLLTADLRLRQRAFETPINLDPKPSLRKDSTGKETNTTAGDSDGSVNKLDLFTNQVFVVRGQWLRSRVFRRPAAPKGAKPPPAPKQGEEPEEEPAPIRNTVVDVNQLYLGMHAMAADLRAKYNVEIRNPVGDQVLLAMLCGNNDYLDKSLLPKAAEAALFGAYFNYCRFFRRGLVANHIRDHKYIGYNVDVHALAIFIIAAYCRVYPKLASGKSTECIQFSNLVEDFQKIEERLTQAKVAYKPNINTARQLAVQASWTLDWYAGCCFGRIPSESTQRIRGRSQYGWCMKTTLTGSGQTVVATEDVSVDWLINLTHVGYDVTRGSTTPTPSRRPVLLPPRPQLHNQFDLLSN